MHEHDFLLTSVETLFRIALAARINLIGNVLSTWLRNACGGIATAIAVVVELELTSELTRMPSRSISAAKCQPD